MQPSIPRAVLPIAARRPARRRRHQPTHGVAHLGAMPAGSARQQSRAGGRVISGGYYYEQAQGHAGRAPEAYAVVTDTTPTLIPAPVTGSIILKASGAAARRIRVSPARGLVEHGERRVAVDDQPRTVLLRSSAMMARVFQACGERTTLRLEVLEATALRAGWWGTSRPDVVELAERVARRRCRAPPASPLAEIVSRWRPQHRRSPAALPTLMEVEVGGARHLHRVYHHALHGISTCWSASNPRDERARAGSAPRHRWAPRGPAPPRTGSRRHPAPASDQRDEAGSADCARPRKLQRHLLDRVRPAHLDGDRPRPQLALGDIRAGRADGTPGRLTAADPDKVRILLLREKPTGGVARQKSSPKARASVPCSTPMSRAEIVVDGDAGIQASGRALRQEAVDPRTVQAEPRRRLLLVQPGDQVELSPPARSARRRSHGPG